MSTHLQKDAVRSLEALADAYAEARTIFRDAERTLRRAVKDLQKGGEGSVAAAMGTTPPAVYRDQVNVALERIERSRHEMRIRLFALARSQGYSITELARQWGFSRQLASRLVNENSSRPATGGRSSRPLTSTRGR